MFINTEDLFKINLGTEIIIKHNKVQFTKINNVSEIKTALKKLMDITHN